MAGGGAGGGIGVVWYCVVGRGGRVAKLRNVVELFARNIMDKENRDRSEERRRINNHGSIGSTWKRNADYR